MNLDDESNHRVTIDVQRHDWDFKFVVCDFDKEIQLKAEGLEMRLRLSGVAESETNRQRRRFVPRR